LSPTSVALPEVQGAFSLQFYSSYTMSIGTTQTFYFNQFDFNGVDRYEFFYPIQSTNNGVIKNTLRITNAINNDFRVDNIYYTNSASFSYWTIDTTTIIGTTSVIGGSPSSFLVAFGSTELSYTLTGTQPGGVVITTQSVPTYSGATGQYGETRLGLSGSTPYLYVYTDQWYQFMGATF
jgi:hypothetical protein